MLPFIAIPVLHSSGAFIAYSGTGYLAGTLSTTWLGAFVMGNTSLLAGVSALTASAVGGVWAGAKSSVTGAAVSLGLISTTPAWVLPASIISGLTLVATGSVAFYKRNQIIDAINERLDDINAERIKAGLSPFEKASDLLDEVLDYIKGMRKNHGNFDSVDGESVQYSKCTDLVPVMEQVDESWFASISSKIASLAEDISDKFTGKNHPHDLAMQQLTNNILSDQQLDNLPHEQLTDYVKNCRDILSLLGSELRVSGISDVTLVKINELDPSGSEVHWGLWCIGLQEILGIKLPNIRVDQG